MLASMVTVLALCGFRVPLFELIELKTSSAPSPAVALAVIDEKSPDAEGRWPWPGSKIAALIDRLSGAGTKVIGFEIMFSEPDENSQVALLDQLASQSDTLAIGDSRLRRFLSERRFEADNDVALVKTIKRSRAAVVLGYFFHTQVSRDIAV
jgi:adenylate cyclase